MSLLRTNYKQCNNRDDEDELFEAHSEIRVVGNRGQVFRWCGCCASCRKHAVVVIASLLVLAGVAIAAIVVCVYLPDILGKNRQPVDGNNGSFTRLRDNPVVQTNCGAFVGSHEGGAFVFKGVPYARAPVKTLRWKKPISLWTDSSWCKANSYREALTFGSPCFQLNPFLKQFEGKEDCLYLNVWTPTLDPGAGLEVMVWIHGGFLQFGSGHQPGLSPSGHLARHLNVVFVSFNFRLHVLGYLALDILVNSLLEDAHGNYGMWDQLVVMQWVRDNILYFGGDPRKVTVFGPDGGSASILVMMTSLQFRNTFRSAWLLGPAMLFNRSFTEASLHNHVHFLQKSGCSDVECLHKMTPKEITGTYVSNDDPSFRIRDQNDLPIQGILPEQLLVVDGDLLGLSPTEAALHRHIKDIPLLIGTSAQSVDFWPGPEDLRMWTWKQYRKYVTTSLDSFGPRVSQLALQMYNTSHIYDDNPSPEMLYSTMVSDVRQTCPVNEMAEMLSTVMLSPVYRYIVTSRPSQEVKVYNYPGTCSSHLWDAIAFLDQMNHYISSPTQEDLEFRDAIQRTVIEFVRSGGHRLPNNEWLRYPKKIALMSTNLTLVDSYHKTKCKFWSAHGLTDYAWVS